MKAEEIRAEAEKVKRNFFRRSGMWYDVEEFHEKFKLTRSAIPTFLEPEIMELRLNFLLEELIETAEACGYRLTQHHPDGDHTFVLNKIIEPNLAQAFDGLIDLVYVALGNAVLMGLDFPEGWWRVHIKNMGKVRAERPEESTRRSTFDVVKPPGWVPADLRDLVIAPNDSGECGGVKFSEGEGHD